MVAKLEGPQFSGGANIAIKCPSHTYEQTVAFYRDTLGLPLIEEEKDGCIFQFGPNRLWIDRVPNLSHPDVWLELETSDTEAAASLLKVHGVTRRDEVEQLREDFNGFFISARNGVIILSLVTKKRSDHRTSDRNHSASWDMSSHDDEIAFNAVEPRDSRQ
jgi:catechol 2,3-dioxygenase-like lactoylglutathione lyase family enzyme